MTCKLGQEVGSMGLQYCCRLDRNHATHMEDKARQFCMLMPRHSVDAHKYIVLVVRNQICIELVAAGMQLGTVTATKQANAARVAHLQKPALLQLRPELAVVVNALRCSSPFGFDGQQGNYTTVLLDALDLDAFNGTRFYTCLWEVLLNAAVALPHSLLCTDPAWALVSLCLLGVDLNKDVKCLPTETSNCSGFCCLVISVCCCLEHVLEVQCEHCVWWQWQVATLLPSKPRIEAPTGV